MPVLCTPCSQDGRYWPIHPPASCSVWVAIDEATEANGAMGWVRSVHRSANAITAPSQPCAAPRFASHPLRRKGVQPGSTLTVYLQLTVLHDAIFTEVVMLRQHYSTTTQTTIQSSLCIRYDRLRIKFICALEHAINRSSELATRAGYLCTNFRYSI